MPRMKEDYNSSKWFRGERMFAPPSLNRTDLADRLAQNFTGNQKERWLGLSTSSAPPSVVPPDPDTEKLPSLEQRREKHVQNRASHLRVKTCPPDYILNPRYYKTIIARNKNFARACKSFTVSPDRTPTGESFRSFVLGARYSDIRYVDSSSVKRWELFIPRKENQETTPQLPPTAATPGTSSSLFKRPISRPKDLALLSGDYGSSRATVTKKKPYSTGLSKGGEDRTSSPLIAVYGSNPQSPRALLHKPSLEKRESSGGRTSQASIRTNTPEIRVTPMQTPSKGEGSDSAVMRRDSLEIDKEEEEEEEKEIVHVAKESSESDFISPFARKITGEILDEETERPGDSSGNEDSAAQAGKDDAAAATGDRVARVAGEGNNVVGLEAEGSSEFVVLYSENVNNNNNNNIDGVAEEMEETQTESEDHTHFTITATTTATSATLPATEAMVEATPIAEHSMTEVPQEETANNMASRSSTIFVDMSNLSIEQGKP